MKRIAVIGCGGAGKSWLAVRLGLRLGLPVVHLDAHYWRDGWTRPTAVQWRAQHEQIIDAHQWVIDGHYASTLARRMEAADTIVLLDLPTASCLAGLLRRRLRRTGPAHPDQVGAERLTWAFVRYVATFRRQRRDAVLEALEHNAGDAQVIVVRSRREVKGLLERFGG